MLVDAYCSKNSCWAVATVVQVDAANVSVRCVIAVRATRPPAADLVSRHPVRWCIRSYSKWGGEVEEVVTTADIPTRLAPHNSITSVKLH
eukprot:SAG11_NODE_95_length_17051_cov_3.557102_12_plen_90_part_00